jgi:general secretion pathway protein D
VGVILDITPHVLASGEVSLHAHVTITSVAGNVPIGGISEPEFGQREIEHDIRLKEGEVSLLGGLVQSTITNTVTGLPGLGQIPLLRYLFSTEIHERNDQEVIVMLTPHVVRLPESNAEAGRAIAVGARSEAGGVPGGFERPGFPQ